MFYKILKYNNNINLNIQSIKINYNLSLNNLTNIKIQKKTTNTSIFLNFILKKEYIYTKLKYSRVPQFDIASGAIAGLLAGLLGFLVTEKFGFELLDSGDFYLILMYIIFIIMIIKIFIKSLNYIITKDYNSNIIWNLYKFYTISINLIINYLFK